MRSIHARSIRSTRIVGFGDSVFEEFLRSIENEGVGLQEGDVLVIASKVVAMEQKAAVELATVTPGSRAVELGEAAKLDPRVAQLVIDESGGEIYGSVPKAILAKTQFGISANAGIDLSNAPEGFALLLPRSPDEYAEGFRQQIKEKFGLDIPVIIADSRTIPLRRGTTGIAIGLSGMDPVIDERGQHDLYGYEMQITTRAVADNLATVANLLMGETDERTPFAIISGADFIRSDRSTIKSTLMPSDQCIYFAPFMKLYRKLQD